MQFVRRQRGRDLPIMRRANRGRGPHETVGGPTAVTVSDPVLLPSTASFTTLFGSTVAVFARLPAELGVTLKMTVKLPVVAPIVTAAPLAVQVSKLLPSIAQAMFAEFVIPVKPPGVGDP